MTTKADDALVGLLSRYVHEANSPSRGSVDYLAVIREEIVEASILTSSAGLCYAIPDKHDNGGKTTKLMTRYRVKPGVYEMVPSKVKS